MFSQLKGKEKVFKPLTTSFNDTILEEYLNNDKTNFKTIKVLGREGLDEEHIDQTVPGRDGTFFVSGRKKPRTIEVNCLIEAKDHQAMTQSFAKLHNILSTTVPERLAFSDDVGYHFWAKYQSVGVPEIRRDSVVFTITFICFDPYKYSDYKEGLGASLTYNGQLPTKPSLSITLSSSGDELRILHVQKQQYIRLIGPFRAGQKVDINCDIMSIRVDDRWAMDRLDMVNSRFFSLSHENTITCNLSSRVEVRYREVMLC